MQIRKADAADIAVLTRLWHDGWRDAHAHLLPPELVQLRTLESFEQRLLAGIERVRVAELAGVSLGFSMLKPDELDQLYVSPQQRGTGLASALLNDAEAMLAAQGTQTAWLACAIGNERAARFYEKHAWQRAGAVSALVETSRGPFPLQVWRYEKALS